MATYVLCHGAWGGSWSWIRVARALREAGHDVFTPSYTGIGERSHLASADVDLSTHIQDVLGVIRYERLDEFVLVGHSYGGMVITGVADKVWRNISRIVYLDAFLPENGQSLNDLTGPERTQATLDVANQKGDGWRVPRPEGSVSASLSDADREWILTLSVDQPLGTFTQKLDTQNNHLKIPEKIYVLATENKGTPFYQFAERTQAREDWTNFDLPTHHHLQVSMPQETADIISGVI
ncbi:MAG: alpha/beta hydrolase [Proteobacteria bacterium]|nr:alpha/beta hydrolase [Pseudomonadota bacterium]